MKAVLVEINPDFAVRHTIFSTSKKLETTDRQIFKYNKILTNLLTRRDFYELLYYIFNSLLYANSIDAQRFLVFSHGNFEPLLVGRMSHWLKSDDFPYIHVNFKMYRHLAKKYLKTDAINLWFERKYAMIGYLDKGCPKVEILNMSDFDQALGLDNTDEFAVQISRQLILHNLPKNALKLLYGGYISPTSEKAGIIIKQVQKMYAGIEISEELTDLAGMIQFAQL